MNRYDFVTVVALFTLVVALPIYALSEPERMENAQENLQWQRITGAGELYLSACAACHGLDGEGQGDMPSLNKPSLRESSREFLFQIIANNTRGTAMAAWHLSEGGPLSRAQIEQLVTLIQTDDWSRVRVLAEQKGLTPPAIEQHSIEQVVVNRRTQPDPHECRACHAEPSLHANQFGGDCARCHALDTWRPAMLVRHTFPLDHGSVENLACQTCHISTYTRHTCRQCHEHQPPQLSAAHAAVDVVTTEDCIVCHPTGQPGEAGGMQKEQASAASQPTRLTEAESSDSMVRVHR